MRHTSRLRVASAAGNRRVEQQSVQADGAGGWHLAKCVQAGCGAHVTAPAGDTGREVGDAGPHCAD